MIDLKYIIDPVMGTIIGFGTNYIAVKMLFRPYNAIKIGKITLPFTPGVIPKRKNEIAKALGDTISKELFTNEDIKDVFLSDEIKEKVSSSIILNLKSDDKSLKELILKNIDEEKYNNLKINIENFIAEKISEGLLKIDIANIIIEEGSKAIVESLKGNFFGGFISEDTIKKMAGPIGKNIEKYLRENVKDLVFPYIDLELSNLESQSVDDILKKLEISDDRLKDIIENLYSKIVEEKMQTIFDSLNISEIIQDKIKAMNINEIERLFMVVMKKELNAIVNLGAFLGLLLGLINAFIL